ncbi:MAG: hypothetical protein RIE53_07300 [Rhodothermales bacterium]
MNWSLPKLLSSLHEDIHNRLYTVRSSIAHPTAKGDGSENVWIGLLNKYLPRRYCATSAFVVDSKGTFSEQVDVVVYDRQFCPLIFEYEGTTVVPAESVYAVFEAKQEVDANQIQYAQAKAATVRRLYRTSLPIPHAGGKYDPKPLNRIIAGILTLDSSWNPPFGASMLTSLKKGTHDEQIDIGCVASHGYMVLDPVTGSYSFETGGKHATGFLLRLITMLQVSATVPMIDVQAYAAWLDG